MSVWNDNGLNVDQSSMFPSTRVCAFVVYVAPKSRMAWSAGFPFRGFSLGAAIATDAMRLILIANTNQRSDIDIVVPLFLLSLTLLLIARHSHCDDMARAHTRLFSFILQKSSTINGQMVGA